MTTMTQAGETILKTDSKGRVQTPAKRREKLLDEFECSGLSGAKFAALAGIKYQTFANWAARRRKQGGLVPLAAKPGDPVQWLEAVVSEAKAPTSKGMAPVKLRWSTGVWMEISELNQVGLAAALVHALEQPLPPC